MSDATRDLAFEPTHTVTYVGNPHGSAEVRAANAALRAIFVHADTVDLWLEADVLADDEPELAASLRETFERVGEDHFRGPIGDVAGPLWDLLELTTMHRSVSLRQLEAVSDDALLARHVPHHHTLRIDVAASPGVDDDVGDALDEEEAILLPLGVLAEWSTASGTDYELSGESVCIDGRACFGLGKLAAVHVDERRQEIRLVWDEPESLSGRLLWKLPSLLGQSRPRRFRFQSAETFWTVADAFEPIGDALD